MKKEIFKLNMVLHEKWILGIFEMSILENLLLYLKTRIMPQILKLISLCYHATG